MADAPFDPLGQLPPLVNDEAAIAPWSWVPPEWNDPAAATAPIDPNEIQMDATDARPPQVTLGMPHDPGPSLDADAGLVPPPDPGTDAGFQMGGAGLNPLAGLTPAQETSAGPLPPMQPGLGLPQSVLDNALITAHPEFSRPPGEMHGEQLSVEQRARQFAASSPEEQARTMYARQQAQETEANKRIAQANLQDEQSALEHHHTLKVAQETAAATTKKLEADAAEEAKREAGPKERSTLQEVAGFIAAALGGLMAGKNGGPNQALDYMERVLQRETAASQAAKNARLQELARRGASNQQLLAQAASDHEESERWRQSMYTRAQNQIATDMGQYDPRGKAAIGLGQMYSAIGQQRAKGLQDFQDKSFKDHVEAMKFGAEMRKADDEHGKSQLEQRKLAGQLGGGGAGSGSTKITPQQFAAQHPQIPSGQLPPDAVPRTEKEYAAYFETNRKGGAAAQATGDVSEGERSRKFGVAGLKNKDGQPWLARNEGDAEKLATKHHVAREVVSIIDELSAIRDRVGGESSAFNSDEFQRMEVLQNQLIKLAKSGTEGMSSDEDMNKLAAAAGAKDVTSFRSKAAGLAEARSRTQSALNSEFSSKGYDGEPVSFSNPYAGGERKETSAEREFKGMLGWQTSQYNYGKDADIIKSHGSSHPDWDARGYNDKQKQYVESAAADLKDAKKADAARARLSEIAKHADSPGYREFAAGLLAPATKADEGPVFK